MELKQLTKEKKSVMRNLTKEMMETGKAVS